MVRGVEHHTDGLVLRVASTWDGMPAAASEIATVSIRATPGGLRLAVDAPFHGDAPPDASPGSCDRLWEHEVVEVFVAGPGERYLEVELGPWGHYLVLVLDAVRHRAGQPVALERGVEASIESRRWRGVAVVPWNLLPPPPHRANAYAVHGSEPRRYLAHAPVPGSAPDFHRLERFVPVALPGVAGGDGENFLRAGDTEER
jgi:hypothetical protein